MAVGACSAGRRSAMTAAALALAVLATAGAGATDAPATLREAELPAGAFSADYRAPTRIPSGIGRVSGTGGVGSDDYLLFDLAPGAQTVTLEFRAPDAVGYSYSAGGVVLFDTQAFAHEWAGTQLPEPIRLDHGRRRQSMAIALPESFRGRLYLALNFTHGEGIAYSLSVPANVPAPMPVLMPGPIPVLVPVLIPVEAPGSLVPLARPVPVPAPAPRAMPGQAC
jgi:hypothetical protein